MFETIDATISESSLTATVLRGTVHFRPDDEYRRLFSLECGSDESNTTPLYLPSLTAWQWVARRHCPVTIDVESQTLRVFEGGEPRLLHDKSSILRLNAGETCQRLTTRDAGYVLSYPLRRPGGTVDGMISIELRDTNDAGDELHMKSGPFLQLLVDLAAPHLAALPSAKDASP